MIELRGVTKRYGQGQAAVQALTDVSLVVPAGSYVAVTGRSGSGKSTLLSIVGCLERPTSGEYRLLGQPITRAPDRELSRLRAQSFGFVFQAFHLLPEKSVLDNVTLPLRYGRLPKAAWRRRARELLGQVGLAERMDSRPSQLSGGEQQRVAIARALANDPKVLLADEPTGNLDSHTRDEIIALLEAEHARGKTLLIVTHDAELAARAQVRLALRDGCVVF
ncbi:ABC transporter ATP-binding protein [Truepera radiovictrix]|uniref:ABC transporter related protein n=1 Tax=Truepera radiovictrix (strain DSM 17093 / CIP 108686 / LMG 22925 / RQ-24) TaxID=649638 RepID=D7CTN1_TRURR|nr:ABC transporter ATP-binding protein [Truepera radiovictrix]ADI13888.1 ABC transporter related protein [Truepera radiovictrix DSM 17093]WMT57548.1 ABC transporter ATP-binding protein [Truepera radiovictrix]